MQADGRYTRITVLRKTIRQHLQHPLTRNGIGIDVHLTKLTIRTDIIHTTHMVVMGMCNKDAVDSTERLWQDLLTKIRTTVDENSRGLRLHQSRATGTLITRILTPAHLTLASDHGYATRGSCS